MTTASRLQTIMGLALEITLEGSKASVSVIYAGHVQYLDVIVYPVGQTFKPLDEIVYLISETLVPLNDTFTTSRLNSIIAQLENLKLETSLKKAI